MNREEKIVIASLDILTFKNSKTGEASEMTRINYLKKKSNGIGYRLLSSYVKGDKTKELEKYIVIPTTKAILTEKDTEKGIEFKLTRIENVNI